MNNKHWAVKGSGSALINDEPTECIWQYTGTSSTTAVHLGVSCTSANCTRWRGAVGGFVLSSFQPETYGTRRFSWQPNVASAWPLPGWDHVSGGGVGGGGWLLITLTQDASGGVWCKRGSDSTTRVCVFSLGMRWYLCGNKKNRNRSRKSGRRPALCSVRV